MAESRGPSIFNWSGFSFHKWNYHGFISFKGVNIWTGIIKTKKSILFLKCVSDFHRGQLDNFLLFLTKVKNYLSPRMVGPSRTTWRLPDRFLFLFFNWSIVDLQRSADFCCSAKWLSSTHIDILLLSILHMGYPRRLQTVAYAIQEDFVVYLS